MNLRRPTILAAILMAIAISPSAVDALDISPIPQPSETLPGFKPNQIYDGTGIENLNLYNGDPQLAVPLGPAYPLGPGSTFQLVAHYSTRFWGLSEVECPNPDGLNPCPGALSPRAQVTGYPTLGVGWTLSLGEISPSHVLFEQRPFFPEHLWNAFLTFGQKLASMMIKVEFAVVGGDAGKRFEADDLLVILSNQDAPAINAAIREHFALEPPARMTLSQLTDERRRVLVFLATNWPHAYTVESLAQNLGIGPTVVLTILEFHRDYDFVTHREALDGHRFAISRPGRRFVLDHHLT